MNEHETRDFPPHWKPHAWLFIPISKFYGYKLRPHFPKDKNTVPRPLVKYLWDGNPSAIAYALKGNFQRRTTLGSRVNSVGFRTRRNVRYRNLRPKQKVELLIAMNRMGLRGRVFLKGAKMAEVDGNVKIRKLAPPKKTR
jgi:hypothetical protein